MFSYPQLRVPPDTPALFLEIIGKFPRYRLVSRLWPKYSSGHSAVRPMGDLHDKDGSTNTPSAIVVFASIVPEKLTNDPTIL